MNKLEEIDDLVNNPLDDGQGNVYWEWPDRSGRHILRVFLAGDEEFVGHGVWEAGVPVSDTPLYAEGTVQRGRGAAQALIRRWRMSNGDEMFVRTVLAGLGRSQEARE